MAALIACIVLFLACFTNFASSATCNINQIPFPGLKREAKLEYRQGEYFTPSCSKGYVPSKPGGKLVCSEGVWAGHFPPCKADNCVSQPPAILHGKPKSFTGHHSSKVEYVCDEFYILTGESTMQCYFANWIGRPPTCKDSRCVFSDLKNKDGVLTPNNNFTLTGQNLNFQCAPGYALTGVTPLCSGGTWVEFGLSPCKENNCTVPDISKGDLMKAEEQQVFKWKKLRHENKTVFKKVKKGTNIPSGHQLQLVCDTKYSFEGKGLKSKTIECSKGAWTPTPSCLKAARR